MRRSLRRTAAVGRCALANRSSGIGKAERRGFLGGDAGFAALARQGVHFTSRDACRGSRVSAQLSRW